MFNAMVYIVCTNIWTGMIRTDHGPVQWRHQSVAPNLLDAAQWCILNPPLAHKPGTNISLLQWYCIKHYTINNKIVVENIMLEWNRTDLTPHLQCSVCLQINIFTLHVSNTTGNTGNPPPAPAPSLDIYVCNCIYYLHCCWPPLGCSVRVLRGKCN